MFVRILTPVLISIVVGMVSFRILEKNDKERIKNLTNEHIIIRLPNAYIWIGCIGTLFLAALLIWAACFQKEKESEPLWIWLGFALFELLGVVLMWAAIVWKIDLFRHEDYFLLRTTFFRTHRIQYCDCISYRIKTNNLVLKTGKKTFKIDLYATNVNFLMEMLRQHKVKEIR